MTPSGTVDHLDSVSLPTTMSLDDSERPTLTETKNPLLRDDSAKTVDLATTPAPNILERPTRANAREIRDLRREASAAAAIAGLDHTTEIYGLTKGRFSMLDLLLAILNVTGPATLDLSTWTANPAQVTTLHKEFVAGRCLAMRWLVDLTFVKRDPAAAFAVRKLFGNDCIRVAQTHTKFALFGNATWRAVLRTSMNLNMNPRTEDFQIAHDPPLYDFLKRFLDATWHRQPINLSEAPSKEIAAHWRTHG
jgi:hypothetical protein